MLDVGRTRTDKAPSLAGNHDRPSGPLGPPRSGFVDRTADVGDEQERTRLRTESRRRSCAHCWQLSEHGAMCSPHSLWRSSCENAGTQCECASRRISSTGRRAWDLRRCLWGSRCACLRKAPVRYRRSLPRNSVGCGNRCPTSSRTSSRPLVPPPMVVMSSSAPTRTSTQRGRSPSARALAV
jgi:hypothetical protein